MTINNIKTNYKQKITIININGLENLQTVGSGKSFFEKNSLTNSSGLTKLILIGGQ